LAALRSFFTFVAEREPLALRQCAEVLHVPFKRAPVPATKYLEPPEATTLLEQPDRSSPKGQRDHVLSSLLYNTGARIQEMLNLRPQDVCLKPLPYIRLMGKGKKERIVSIWPETATAVAAFMRQRNAGVDEPLFLNRYGKPLGRWISILPAQICAARNGEGIFPLSKARHAPSVPPHDRCSPHCGGGRFDGRSRLAGTCPPGYY
jgi:site-specific recombinase XerD